VNGFESFVTLSVEVEMDVADIPDVPLGPTVGTVFLTYPDSALAGPPDHLRANCRPQGKANKINAMPATSLGCCHNSNCKIGAQTEGTRNIQLMDDVSGLGARLNDCSSKSAAFSSPFVRTIASRVLLAF
jgi:hypothetical protein